MVAGLRTGAVCSTTGFAGLAAWAVGAAAAAGFSSALGAAGAGFVAVVVLRVLVAAVFAAGRLRGVVVFAAAGLTVGVSLGASALLSMKSKTSGRM